MQRFRFALEPLSSSTLQKAVSVALAATTSLVILAATSHVAGLAHAQMPMSPPVAAEPMIYPAHGQSPMQQSRDKYECHEWAKRQTGFDPAQASYASGQSMQSMQSMQAASGAAATGAMVRGAAGGAAVAELTHHDPARGAAIGVLGGGMIAHAKQQQAAQMKQQQAAQQQQARGQQKSAYDRALAACMDARGYTVR